MPTSGRDHTGAADAVRRVRAAYGAASFGAGGVGDRERVVGGVERLRPAVQSETREIREVGRGLEVGSRLPNPGDRPRPAFLYRCSWGFFASRPAAQRRRLWAPLGSPRSSRANMPRSVSFPYAWVPSLSVITATETRAQPRINSATWWSTAPVPRPQPPLK